jgi:polysaccharide biosynthesis/export protein
MKKLVPLKLVFFLSVCSLFLLDSCKLLNPNIMIVAGRDYPFDTLSKDTTVAKESRLNPNDVIEFRLFANDGIRMVDVVAPPTAQSNALSRAAFDYPLDNEGVVRLPILGNVNLSGMTIREAEIHLEERYSEFYVKPFVQIKVINKRIIVYPGEPGQAKVIALSNNNTTVIEALAQAGGISANGKAYNVKLIRQTNDPKKPFKVYKLNLSKIEPGLNEGMTVVQSGDIIYVEPRRQIASRTLREVTPIITLVTSMITFYYLVTRL